MFNTTDIFVNSTLVDRAKELIPAIDFRLSINEPTGDFFYDPWEIKLEFKNTVWEEILTTLPYNKGEARLIKLDPGTCYIGHADIDDRWHLSINATDSYLINLETAAMFKTECDYRWHSIDAGVKHSAANFSNKPRVQLVIRKLLCKGTILNPVNVKLTLKKIVEDRRYIFDDLVSPWLNSKNKQGLLDNFKAEEFKVTFTTDATVIENLITLTSDYFNIEVNK